MEEVGLIRILLSFVFVLGLMYALAWVVKKSGLQNRLQKAGKGQPTLEVMESLFLDPRRRMLIVRRGKTNYVMLLGQQSETLIDTYESEPPVEENVVQKSA